MTHYSIVAALGAIVLIYFLSALSPLPWYHYVPFIGLIVLAYFWADLRRLLCSRLGTGPHLRRSERK